MGLVLKNSWLRKGTGWVEKDTMMFSFTKKCPHCSQKLSFEPYDDWKEEIHCPYCDHLVEFTCTQDKILLVFLVEVWVIFLFDTFLPFPASVSFLFLGTLYVSIPLSKLKLRKGEPESFQKYYLLLMKMTVFSFVLLGAISKWFGMVI